MIDCGRIHGIHELGCLFLIVGDDYSRMPAAIRVDGNYRFVQIRYLPYEYFIIQKLLVPHAFIGHDRSSFQSFQLGIGQNLDLMLF